MEKKLREIAQQIIVQIDKCEYEIGKWNGEDSGYLEDHAQFYGEVRSFLEESKNNLLKAIMLLKENI